MAKATKRTKSKKAATPVSQPLTISIHGKKIDLDARLDLDDDGANDLLALFEKIGASINKSAGTNPNPLEDIEMHDDFLSFVTEEAKRCPDQLLDQVIVVLQTERASRQVPANGANDANDATETEPTPVS